jgi:phosphoglycolate phosphatase
MQRLMTPMLRWQLIIFDFDGTLADSFPWFRSELGDLARRWGFRDAGADEDEALRRMSASAVFRHLGVPGWKLPLIAADLRRRMSARLDEIRLFDGVAPMLERLAAGDARLAIASSNAAANVDQLLGARLRGLIHDSECGAPLSGKHSRLKRLLRRARVDPRLAIYVGDEVRDIEAARRAGIAAGAVTWGYNRAAVLRHYRPDLIFDEIGQLAQLGCNLRPRPD